MRLLASNAKRPFFGSRFASPTGAGRPAYTGALVITWSSSSDAASTRKWLSESRQLDLPARGGCIDRGEFGESLRRSLLESLDHFEGNVQRTNCVMRREPA